MLFSFVPAAIGLGELPLVAHHQVAALLDRRHARRRAGRIRPALDQQRDPPARPHPRDRGEPAAPLAPVRLVAGPHQRAPASRSAPATRPAQRTTRAARRQRRRRAPRARAAAPRRRRRAVEPLVERRTRRPRTATTGFIGTPAPGAPGCARSRGGATGCRAHDGVALLRRGALWRELASCRSRACSSVARRAGADRADARASRPCACTRSPARSPRRSGRRPRRRRSALFERAGRPSAVESRRASATPVASLGRVRATTASRPSPLSARGRLGVGIIGAGRVGPVLGAALAGAGHAIVGIAAVSDAEPRAGGRACCPACPCCTSPRSSSAASSCCSPCPTTELAALVAGLAAAGAWQPGQLVLHTAARFGTRRARSPRAARGRDPARRASGDGVHRHEHRPRPAARDLVRGHGAGPGAADRARRSSSRWAASRSSSPRPTAPPTPRRSTRRSRSRPRSSTRRSASSRGIGVDAPGARARAARALAPSRTRCAPRHGSRRRAEPLDGTGTIDEAGSRPAAGRWRVTEVTAGTRVVPTIAELCARSSPSVARPGQPSPSCRPWARCTRGTSRSSTAPRARRRRRRVDLREPAAVRRRRGPRPLPAHLDADVAALAGTASTSSSRRRVDEMYPTAPIETRGDAPATSATLLRGRARAPGTSTACSRSSRSCSTSCSPTSRVFGQKDAQQVFLVQRMVRDLDLPIAHRGRADRARGRRTRALEPQPLPRRRRSAAAALRALRGARGGRARPRDRASTSVLAEAQPPRSATTTALSSTTSSSSTRRPSCPSPTATAARRACSSPRRSARPASSTTRTITLLSGRGDRSGTVGWARTPHRRRWPTQTDAQPSRPPSRPPPRSPSRRPCGSPSASG